jgi:hypothetical protein
MSRTVITERWFSLIANVLSSPFRLLFLRSKLKLELQTEPARITALVLLVLSLLSCHSPASKEGIKQNSPAATPPQMLTDANLVSLVNRIVTGEGDEEAVIAELELYPRTEVIDRLRNLQDGNANERDHVAIAYLLCNLGDDVTNNKQVIVNAFNKQPHQQNNDADWQAELIWRLLKKGHNDLLPVLFQASEWSDGALSEGLADYFTEQRRADPKNFATELSRQPKTTRQAVYRLLRYASRP